MLIRFWGTRGSLPVALTWRDLRDRLARVLVAANGRGLDTVEKAQAFAEYATGPHNLRFTVNFIDSYVDQRTSIFAPNAATGLINPNGAKIPDTWLAELDYRVELPWETTATLSIDNLFDTDPGFARLDLNYDPFTGNALGRTYKISVRKRF